MRNACDKRQEQRVDEAPVSSVKTIGRAAQVLRVLAEDPEEGSRLSDVAQRLQLGKGTVHRLLSALVEVGFAEHSETTKRYRLGHTLFALGAAARRFHIVEIARPSLLRLAGATGDTVYLSVRDGDEALCVDRCTGAFPIRTLTLDIGDRRPLGVGAGALALLAFLPEREIERILRVNRASRQSYPAFDDETLRLLIAQARATGYAFNDGNIVAAMTAIGAPVRDAEQKVVAALSIAAIRERMSPGRIVELQSLLQAEAQELAITLADPTGTAERRPQHESRRSA